jgi:hypothetical protein
MYEVQLLNNGTGMKKGFILKMIQIKLYPLQHTLLPYISAEYEFNIVQSSAVGH